MSATDESAAPRCATAWGLMLGALLLLLLAVVLPWAQALVALDEDIAAKRDQLARFQRLGATLPALRAELDSVRVNEDFKAFYFSAPTSALAGAALQGRVQEIVNQAEGRLVSTQILPEGAQEEPARVRVRAQIQGSTETLLEVLYQIEQTRPFLFVEQIAIRSSARPPLPQGHPRRNLPGNASGELTVRIDLFGFTLEAGA